MKTLLFFMISFLVSISAVASQTYSCTHSFIEHKGYFVTVDQQRVKSIQSFTKIKGQTISLGFEWEIIDSELAASGGELHNFTAMREYYSVVSGMRGTLEIEDPATMLHLEVWSDDSPVETFSGSCLKKD